MKKLRTFRLVFQIVFAAAFVFFFFVLNTYPTAYDWASEWFLWLNPLVALTTSVAGRGVLGHALLWSALVLVATIVFGRFFCGMVCPLGSIIDFSDRFLWRRIRKKSYAPPRSVQSLKYVLLLAVLVFAVFGFVFPLFYDPISLVTRFSSLLFYPLVGVVQTEGQQILRPVLIKIGAEASAYAHIKSPVFYGGIGAFAMLTIIVGTGIFDKRFWCQYVCPSGAFFGLMGRFAAFRRQFQVTACDQCKVCAAVCPTHAINDKQLEKTRIPECIVCGLCSDVQKGCSRFGFARPVRVKEEAVDLQRRGVIAGVVGGSLFVPVFRASSAQKRDLTGRLIRPPGAVPEKGFAAKCLACGECMKACPTNAIQPCVPGDGFQRIFTPKIVPRIGGCEEKCSVCGYVCPTGAIRDLPYDEKRYVKIGTAVVDRHRCLAWEQNKECLVCDEICPYNAITAQILETTTGRFKVPVVDENLCLGCGMCEQHCPIFDKAAIVVYKFGENRRARGPYLSEWERQAVDRARRKTDDHVGASLKGGEDSLPDQSGVSPSPEEQPTGLPPGFTFD